MNHGWWRAWCLVALITALGQLSQGLPGVHLDHVPIAVRDLGSTTAQFRALGFTIKPGRPHQNGIENASIKFADGSYVELITSHNGTDALARQYEEFLKRGEGASYVFLRDSNGGFAERVRQAGGHRSVAGPFAFTELPSSWRAPHLQLTEYLSPAIDPPETYQHANGARRLVAVWLFEDEGVNAIDRELGAEPAVASVFGFDDRTMRSVSLADHTRLFLTPRGAVDPPHVLASAILLEVESVDRLKPFAGLERARSRPGVRWLPPSQMHGVWLGFVEPATWAH